MELVHKAAALTLVALGVSLIGFGAKVWLGVER
jgi:hypothetical protein